jgi:hypothetical protein
MLFGGGVAAIAEQKPLFMPVVSDLVPRDHADAYREK